MALLASGALALQDAGTNSSTTTANSLESDALTRGQDGYVDIRTLYENAGGDTFSTKIEWKGQVGGYQSGTSVYSWWMSGSSFPILTSLIDALPLSNGVRSGTPTFSSEPGNFGSIGATSYLDGSNNSRSIRAIIFGNPSSSPSPNNTRHWVIFVLNGTSVPNTDNTFKSLKLTGSGTTYTFTRSSAHYNAASNTCSCWAWEYNSTTSNNGIDSLYTSGTSGFEIMGPDVTTTVNNGIAEEFGGADSSNVALSDYYKGDLHDTTGIPTSGEIKFSDFLGKTYAPLAVSTSFTGQLGGGKQQRTGFSFTFGLGSNLSPTSQDAFGANVDLRDCYSQDNNYRLNIMYDINSGTVDTTSWSTLTVSRSGYTSFTISRSSLSTNAVTVGNYYMTTPSNTLTSTQFYMISGGTVTLTFT
jgi:hypothetical protein